MDSTEHLANKEMTPWGPLPAGSSLSSYYNSVEEEEQWRRTQMQGSVKHPKEGASRWVWKEERAEQAFPYSDSAQQAQ